MGTTPAQRLLGLLLAAITVVGLFFLSGPLLAEHPAWQREVTAKITSSIADPSGNDFDNSMLVVEAPGANYLAVDSWNGGAIQGDQVKVWVLMPTGYQAGFASQTPYPAELHGGRVTLFVL